MDNKIGLIDQEVRLIKRDDELTRRILSERSIEVEKEERVREMLRYNLWTITQFSDITGLAISTIANKCRPVYKNGVLMTDLDFCYPFADIQGTGPKFIVRNEKSERYLP